MNISVNPYAPALFDDEALVATVTLNKSNVFKKVVRNLTDPPIVGQHVSLFSFIPHPDAKTGPSGRFGYLKIRGAFASELDAKNAAYNLIKNHDSYNEIIHVRTGMFIPLNSTFTDIDEVDEVQLNSEMVESISQQINSKKKDDETKIAEIKEQERKFYRKIKISFC